MEPLSVIRAALVVPSPDSPPLPAHRIVVRDGVVDAVEKDTGPVPDGAKVVDARASAVVAGLWNTHVHLTPRSLGGARKRPSTELEAGLAEMLSSRGFTTVVDLGSDPRNTRPLRRRVDRGEVAGPHILTALSGLHPHRGLPFYTRAAAPRYLWWAIPTPRTPGRAAAIVRRQQRLGADVTKLFTGSYVTPAVVKPMRTDIARAAVRAAHELGQLVFSHTSNRDGLEVALDAGVDVIAHVPDETDGVAPLLRRAAADGVAMVPTFQMFARTVTDDPAYLDPIIDAARTFLDAGGRMMFGTDVGYMGDPTITDELSYLGRCGIQGADLLRMFTTTPVEIFGASGGRIERGMPADLTVVDGDPLVDPTAYTRVRLTMKSGRTIWSSPTR